MQEGNGFLDGVPTRSEGNPQRGDFGRHLLLMALIALLAAVPYFLHGGLRAFIAFDDSSYVFKNAVVLQGLTVDGFRWAFTAFHSGNWHPLTWLSHMLDVSLFGKVAWGHHFTSVLLHATNTVLLFLVLTRLTGMFWRSGSAAVLFAVHPLRVESVAWVAERKDVLSGLFFLLVLLAYERQVRRGGARRRLLVGVLLAFGLMAKPMLVTVPFVLLLLDVWPLGRLRPAPKGGGCPRASHNWGALVREKLPLLVLCAISCVLTFLAQRESAAVKEMGYVSLGVRIANAILVYLSYIGKTLWPSDLAVLYPHSLRMPLWWQVAGAALLLAAVSATAFRLLKRCPYLAVGWFWFLGMLVPVIGLVQVGEQAMADRYTYLPALGLGLLIAWGLSDVVHGARLPPVTTGIAASFAFVGLLAATASQVGRWKDSETLFRHTLAVTTGNALILNNLGALLNDEGRNVEAIPYLREALLVRPNYYNARYNLATALAGTGKLSEAIVEYREASRRSPDRYEAYNNLGIALARTGRFEEAIIQFRNALRLQPETPATRFNLGLALTQTRRFDEAILHLQEALRLRPGHLEYHRALELARSRASASRTREPSAVN